MNRVVSPPVKWSSTGYQLQTTIGCPYQQVQLPHISPKYAQYGYVNPNYALKIEWFPT